MKPHPNSSTPLLIVLPAHGAQNWQLQLIDELVNLPELSTTLVLTGPDDKRARGGTAFERWKTVDLRLFRGKLLPGPSGEEHGTFDPGNYVCERVSSTHDICDLVAEKRDGAARDIVLWLIHDRPPTALCEMRGIRIWTISNARAPAVGYRELVDRTPTIRCELVSMGVDASGDRVIADAYAPTDPLSINRGLQIVRAKDRALVVASLRHRHNGVPGPQVSGETCPNPVNATPGPLRLGIDLVRLYCRYAKSLVTRRFYYEHWQIAYRHGGHRLDRSGLIPFKPSHRGFWADPFVAQHSGESALFFEELPEGESNGDIVVSKFESGTQPGPPRTIITRDYHLSYPFVFEFDGSLFMTPESAAAGKVEAFRCTEFPYRWEPYKVLLENITAYDPTLIEHDGKWWMFVAVEHNGNTSSDELHLFYADSPFSRWTPHPQNPISTDVRCARPAGALFIENGELYRPAQDSSVRYGYAISIRRVIEMTVERYREEASDHIRPDWGTNSIGTHTVNQAAGVTVYDSFARCRR